MKSSTLSILMIVVNNVIVAVVTISKVIIYIRFLYKVLATHFDILAESTSKLFTLGEMEICIISQYTF